LKVFSKPALKPISRTNQAFRSTDNQICEFVTGQCNTLPADVGLSFENYIDFFDGKLVGNLPSGTGGVVVNIYQRTGSGFNMARFFPGQAEAVNHESGELLISNGESISIVDLATLQSRFAGRVTSAFSFSFLPRPQGGFLGVSNSAGGQIVRLDKGGGISSLAVSTNNLGVVMAGFSNRGSGGPKTL
jgi:hypothetical protein